MTSAPPSNTIQYNISHWNVENLFDHEKAPRDPSLQGMIQHDLTGWTEELRDNKINNLAHVIARMHNGAGPDLLCVCEVENRHVLELLCAALAKESNHRVYEIVHADSPDKRGIDVAMLYDPKKLKYERHFSLQLMKRSPTRDLFQVNFRTVETNRLFIAIGNHWPSRRGGSLESEPYRILAAETLSYWMLRIREIAGPEVPVICMGDLNDEPFDRSVRDFALSTRHKERVLASSDPMLYNLMWPLLGQRLGSIFFDEPQMFDQFMVSRGLISSRSPFAVDEQSVRLETEHMRDTRVSFPRPSRMGLPSSRHFYPKGFSDHFPISCVVTEQKEFVPPPPSTPIVAPATQGGGLSVPGASATDDSRAASPLPAGSRPGRRGVGPAKS